MGCTLCYRLPLLLLLAAHWCCVICLSPQSSSTSKKSSTSTTTVVPDASFNLPLGLLAISGVSAYEHITTLAAISGALGVFLAAQATRVRYMDGFTTF
eukprot:jgi/Chrzof1/969/Cz01g35070.t1